MARADDQDTPAEEPEAAASSSDASSASAFWQRYSERAKSSEQSAAEAEPGTGTAGDTGAAGDEVPPLHSHRGEALDREGHQCLDWCPICRGADLLRETVPPELQEQFRIVQRDALLLAQAMIEAHLERLKREAPGQGRGVPGDGPEPPPEESGVSSIPIE